VAAQKTTPTINAKKAVDTALLHFKDLYDDLTARDPLLEEVELSKDRKSWLVTVGFNVVESEPPSPLEEMMAKVRPGAPLLGPLPDTWVLKRRYRVFKVDAESGEVTSMKATEP
jgi:hypothetical protein